MNNIIQRLSDILNCLESFSLLFTMLKLRAFSIALVLTKFARSAIVSETFNVVNAQLAPAGVPRRYVLREFSIITPFNPPPPIVPGDSFL